MKQTNKNKYVAPEAVTEQFECDVRFLASSDPTFTMSGFAGEDLPEDAGITF